MIDITEVVVSPFQQNCRIISSADCSEAVLIDPGAEPEAIIAILNRRGLKLSQIWLTHSHLDHCGAVGRLKSASGAVLYGHISEVGMRGSVEQIATMYGIPKGIMENCPEPDVMLQGGEKLEFAGEVFEVLHAPGHSTGSLCYYHAASARVIVGDVLFAGSIGRTDLPGGDYDTLIRSIREKLLVLPAATKVLSGHGESSSIGEEAAHNAFLQAR